MSTTDQYLPTTTSSQEGILEINGTGPPFFCLMPGGPPVNSAVELFVKSVCVVWTTKEANNDFIQVKFVDNKVKTWKIIIK